MKLKKWKYRKEYRRDIESIGIKYSKNICKEYYYKKYTMLSQIFSMKIYYIYTLSKYIRIIVMK